MFMFVLVNSNLLAENLSDKYSKECEKGDFSSCNRLGVMYYICDEGIK